MVNMDFPSLPPFLLLYGADFASLHTVHLAAYFTDVDIDRALSDTSSAAHAHNTGFIFVDKIFKFVHKTLTHTLQFGSARVVSCCMNGKNREHAAVPVSHPLS